MTKIKHHYIPQFYLDRWSDKKDGKVFYFSYKNYRIIPGKRNPEYLGFEDDLYTLDHVDENQKNSIETGHYQIIDNDAAVIITKIINIEISNLSSNEKL